METAAPVVRPVAPLWLKIPVIVAAVWHLMIVNHDLRFGAPILKVVLEGVMLGALLAIWRMHRWGVFVAVALTFVHVAFGALNPTTLWRGPLAAAAVGTIVFAASALAWLRMTTR